MSYGVTLEPGGAMFFAEAGEMLLDAALRQGVALAHSCRQGICGACRVQLISGQIDRSAEEPVAMDGAESGEVLCCRASARSDLVLSSTLPTGRQPLPVRKLLGRVAGIRRTGAADVLILSIKLPREAELDFRPGQYVDLTTREGVRRSYSIAQASGRGDCLEFHIRHCPGGRFTDGLFNERESRPGTGHIVQVEGPYGSMWLREADAPVILLASGTGFAPIKAMVEEAMRLGIHRPMRLYWGGRRPADLYMDALCRHWAAAWDGFSYIPVVSDACDADAWQGRTGWVHRAVMEDIADLAAYHVYACGAPIVVESARQDFSRICGLPRGSFFADAFVTAKDLSSGVCAAA